MKNFYTQNGWEGKNYDSNLKIKDIAAKVREYAKKKYPEFKFSVRSGWSTYTGTITISLMGGKCYPFVEGSKSAERGYMRTMSTIGGFEKDLTPEVFEALDDVTSYANSFNYDDSDGMIDYFDTNFFLHIEIEKGYKLIEPKTRKQNEAKTVEPANIEGVEIVDYSEKAIAVFGNTKEIKEQLKALGGKFNPALKYEGGKCAGWIFSKKQADKVRALLAPSTDSSKEQPEKIDNEGINNLPDNILTESDNKETIRENKTFEAEKLAEKFGMSCNYDKFGKNYWFTFKDKNIKDEEIKICISKSENPGGRGNLPEIWYKKGYTGQVLQTWWSVETYVTDKKGNCRGDYNPQNQWDGKRNVLNFKYVLEATPENAEIIFEEIRKRAFALPEPPKEVTLPENVEFYEKKITGERFQAKDNPDKIGYFHIIDMLDNAACDFYRTKEEAQERAKYLNGLTNAGGRIINIAKAAPI